MTIEKVTSLLIIKELPQVNDHNYGTSQVHKSHCENGPISGYIFQQFYITLYPIPEYKMIMNGKSSLRLSTLLQLLGNKTNKAI